MLRRIRLCVSQSRPMKPAATISRVKVPAVSWGIKNYSAPESAILELLAS